MAVSHIQFPLDLFSTITERQSVPTRPKNYTREPELARENVNTKYGDKNEEAQSKSGTDETGRSGGSHGQEGVPPRYY